MIKLNRRKFCECNCGTPIKSVKRFVSGHNLKTEASRKAASNRRKQTKPWNTGLTKETDERVALYGRKGGERRKGKPRNPCSEEHKQKIGKINSIKMTILWQDKEYRERQSKSHKNKQQTEEHKRKTSKANKISIKNLWDNMPDKEKSERLTKTLKSNCNRPNKLELTFLALLNVLYPNIWKYTGDGSFWVRGRNPDFTCENLKLLIEVFGDYWHRNGNPQDRIDHFKKFGWDTLVIWEHEINENIEAVRGKVIEFVNQKRNLTI